MYNESIITNNLSIGYNKHIVQKQLSFSLKQGEIVCMLGTNGCGKSTLLKTLAGLIPPVEGTYRIQTTQSSQIALVLTEKITLDTTTVHDVVAMGRYPYTSLLGTLTPHDEQIIEQAIKDVGLDHNTEALLNSYFSDHSDGEKQRILIAKAIAQQTPIILLDEPTAHLDLPNRIRTLQLLRQLAHQQQKTILISTHELQLAIQLADRIMLMTPNQGVLIDTPNTLIQAKAFDKAFGMDIFDYRIADI